MQVGGAGTGCENGEVGTSHGGLTFVFSDIEGSTRLVKELAAGYGLALRICRRILVNAFAERGGREFGNEGDGQFFVFPTAVAAAHAALDAQARIADAEWSDGILLRVRMGIHGGPVRLSGGVYVGMTIHEVARVCTAANGGQILCTTPVARDLAVEPGIDVRELGRFVLRGIDEPHPLFQVCAAGSDVACLPPRDAIRDGGRRVVIWRRDGDGGVAAGRDGVGLTWTALAAGVDVSIDRQADGAVDVIRLTVWRDGVVEEEYDGLTIGGATDAAAIVNACSKLISIP